MEIIENISGLPLLTHGLIHIWGIHVPDMSDRLDALQALLNEAEVKKAARFSRIAEQHASITARGALRILLSGYCGLSPTEIEFHYTENGKPHVTGSDVDFNISHSGDWVVLAFGRNRNIGVDVERIKRELDIQRVASRFFRNDEIALIQSATDPYETFFQLWARKEAYVKACGSTLFRELGRFSVPLDDSEKGGWHFLRLEAGAKYAAAVVTDRAISGVPCYDFGGLIWDN